MYKVVPQNRKNYFSQLGGDICYSIDFDKRLMYYTVSYCDDRGDTILEWSDYMEFTKEDLKVGMLVETDLGNGIVMPSSSELVAIYKNGEWDSVNFDDIIKVYGYSNEPCFAMSYSSFRRDLLYERRAPTVKEMTVEEISKALGCEVKIIKG